MIRDNRTGFPIGDSAELIFSEQPVFSREEKEKFLENTIFSVSGWRRVFALDGDEESSNPEITVLDKILVGGAARIFAEFLRETKRISNPLVLLAIDSRHTGPVIALVMARAFLAYGVDVRYVFISGAPEAMSCTKVSDELDGFMYVTASHNPIGHNGLKCGLSDGAVLGKEDAQPLIDKFKKAIFDDQWISEMVKKIDDVPSAKVEEVLQGVRKYKTDAMSKYWGFTDQVITGIDDFKLRRKMLENIKIKIKKIGIGVLAEFNGSARGVSIDVDYLKNIGIDVTALNEKPREFVHRIVPEGESLDLAREELKKLSDIDNKYRFAYVPDCDGDRGNIVTLDSKGEPCILEAQEVFALSVVSELAYLVYGGKLTYDDQGKPRQKVAVVVNGPTSGRIEKIAQAFGVEVFRAEVGEANVVSLASKKCEEGYIVRILGEGSNGGNITLPSTVRDPINTIFAFIKMLVLRSESGRKGLFEIWCEKLGRQDLYCQDVELYHVVDSLPSFTTTSAFEEKAKVSITTTDHAKLKANYEKIFLAEWDQKKDLLSDKFGISSYSIINYEGIFSKQGIGSSFRSGLERGGFKVLFSDENGIEKSFIWMRGSGTEPVFRVLADVEGNDVEAEKFLLDWHIDIVKQADKS